MMITVGESNLIDAMQELDYGSLHSIELLAQEPSIPVDHIHPTLAKLITLVRNVPQLAEIKVAGGLPMWAESNGAAGDGKFKATRHYRLA
jgi:hypothetical protein